MKRYKVIFFVLCLLLAGCTNNTSNNSNNGNNQSSGNETEENNNNNNNENNENGSGNNSSGENTNNNDSGNNNNNQGGNSGSNNTPEEPNPTTSIQDMTILHAWNWRMNDVKSRLQAIKNAGYGAIQISPMQPKVDKNNWASESTKSQWWKLYQPLAFKVAEGDETFLGTKSDLTALCTEAKKYEIKIVVDVVSNHLAGTNNNYNTQVYTKYPLHNAGGTSDNSVQAVVQGHIGLPDLDTSNSQVQQDVLSMLKSYIDCGVSGFRFDAAKHIETPDDGAYASNYWPTVLNGTTTYSESKNDAKPYYYGEILYTCGTGRQFSSYTKYMSVTDNVQGSTIVNAVNSKNLNSITKTYNTGVDPDHLVLWAESHDTYANDSGYESTRNYTTETINKAYIIQASRKDAASLYLARPTDMNVAICTVNDNNGWKNPEIAAINKFHTRYVGREESISNNNGCFVNVRGSSSFAGAAIVNISGSSTATVEVKGLNDGAYTDLVSNKDFTVSNGKVNASFTNGACILIPKGSSVGGNTNSGTGDNSNTGNPDVTYNSSVVLKGYNSSLSYLLWTWSNSNSGSWKAFNSDHDALGVNLNSGDNYIIVEFPSGTTTNNANWDNKIRQTIDMSYSGSQIIHDYNSLTWK